MPIGRVTNRALKPLVTSAGTIHIAEKAGGSETWRDVVDAVHAAARLRDGAFSVSAVDEAGGVTLTVTTNAGVVSITHGFSRGAVDAALDYLTNEGATVDGLG